MASKPKIMSWTPLHDIVLCKEIIFVNPYSAKKKSVQRRALWQKIADNLNSVKDSHFIVDKRAVRDHIGILIQRFKRQEAQELKESGITSERTELDAAVEQIIAMEESADTEMQEAIDENKEKVEADRRKAEDMREKAMETMGKTQKRKSEEGSSKARKSRRSGSEAVEYLEERAAEDLKLKSQEIELKKQEKEQLQALQTQQTQIMAQMFKTMIDQQQQQQKQVQDMQNLFLIQQQTQSQALMGIIEKLVPK
ncbi:caldesmon-like [Montipora capricornis]|uniref:caldesmon-like n=1 Tax=Montipora capricornis TaxID=246305 RepID=UPI0035F16FB6